LLAPDRAFGVVVAIVTASSATNVTKPAASRDENKKIAPFLGVQVVFTSLEKLDQGNNACVPVSRDQIQRLETQLRQFQRAQWSAFRIGVFFLPIETPH
jgi:hypothetical protein